MYDIKNLGDVPSKQQAAAKVYTNGDDTNIWYDAKLGILQISDLGSMITVLDMTENEHLVIKVEGTRHSLHDSYTSPVFKKLIELREYVGVGMSVYSYSSSAPEVDWYEVNIPTPMEFLDEKLHGYELALVYLDHLTYDESGSSYELDGAVFRYRPLSNKKLPVIDLVTDNQGITSCDFWSFWAGLTPKERKNVRNTAEFGRAQYVALAAKRIDLIKYNLDQLSLDTYKLVNQLEAMTNYEIYNLVKDPKVVVTWLNENSY